MEGISGKRQYMGARRTIACTPIVKRVSRPSSSRIHKSRADTTSKVSPFPHWCMPPLLQSLHCPCCIFSTTHNRDLQYHTLIFHSTHRFHKCPLCPKRFKLHSGFEFHLSHTHEFNPAIIHHFRRSPIPHTGHYSRLTRPAPRRSYSPC